MQDIVLCTGLLIIILKRGEKFIDCEKLTIVGNKNKKYYESISAIPYFSIVHFIFVRMQ
jgi:hypothetical protein